MLQSYLLLLSAVVTAVASQFLFKKGMEGMGAVDFSLANFWLVAKNALKSPLILTGLVSYGVSFILWLFVLSRLKLSIAYPFTALNIVLVTVVSYLFLKESISILQIVSIVLICTGIVLLARS